MKKKWKRVLFLRGKSFPERATCFHLYQILVARNYFEPVAQEGWDFELSNILGEWKAVPKFFIFYRITYILKKVTDVIKWAWRENTTRVTRGHESKEIVLRKPTWKGSSHHWLKDAGTVPEISLKGVLSGGKRRCTTRCDISDKNRRGKTRGKIFWPHYKNKLRDLVSHVSLLSHQKARKDLKTNGDVKAVPANPPKIMAILPKNFAISAISTLL